MSLNPSQNWPIYPEYFKPRIFEIIAIARGPTTLITTKVDHDYCVMQQVRLIISEVNGSWQISNEVGYIISIPQPNQIVVNIDSSNANDFVIPTTGRPIQIIPQVLAVGDANSGNINANPQSLGLSPAGTFVNIS